MIVIIHFHPLELYPPVMNDIDAFRYTINSKIYVITTSASKNVEQYKVDAENIKIIRFGRFNLQNGWLLRYAHFILFFLRSTFHLLYYKPKTIFYFETISSFPVFIYKIIFKAKCRIFIHYHEYISKEEYKNSTINKWLHNLEKKLYPSTDWISHTTNDRMLLFLSDIEPVTPVNTYLLPNYPPKAWYSNSKSDTKIPVKIIYVGALSMQTMYTQQFANWVVKQEGNIIWDIYPGNITEEVRAFLKSLNTPFIKLKDRVNYHSLKDLLPGYSVGVILYKGHNSNYTFNAPNKLFEYHACGLDIWVPDTITGSALFITKNTYPKILLLDFEKLDKIDYLEAIKRDGYHHCQYNLNCEEALNELTNKLTEN